MAISGVTELAARIPEMWSAKIYPQLRNQTILANMFDTGYTGDLKIGDVLNVQQFAAPTGEILTDDEATFAVDTLAVTNKTITVNKRASAAYDFSDLASLQSLKFEEDVTQGLIHAVRKQLESAIIAALIPSAAAPDHQLAPASAGVIAAADLNAARTALSTALVPVEGRFAVMSPDYYGSMMLSTNIMSRDFTAGNNSNMGVVDSFLGFRMQEHNLLAATTAFFCHPSALQLVIQQDIRIKLSDLHSTGKYGYRISADLVYGFSLFDNQRIVKISG